MSPLQLSSPLSSLFRPIIQLRTYKRALYLLLSVPIGLLYATILGFSLTLGLVLSVVLVGLLVLAVVVLVVRAVPGPERWLAERLLDVDLNPPASTLDTGGFWQTMRAYVQAPSTWRALGFMTLRTWFAIVGVMLLYGLSVAYSLLMSVINRPQQTEFGELNGEPVTWTVESVPEAGLAAILFLAVLFVMVHLLNLFGYVAGRVAEALLQ